MAAETHRAGLLKPGIVQLLHGFSLRRAEGEVVVGEGGDASSSQRRKVVERERVAMVVRCESRLLDPLNFKDEPPQTWV